MSLSTRWEIAWDGEVYREDDWTIAQACAFEVDRGGTWLICEPTKRVTDAILVLGIMASERTSVDKNEIRAAVGKLSAAEFRKRYLRLVTSEVDWRPEPPKPDEQWVFKFDDRRYTKSDVTLEQAQRIEALAGANWYGAHPLLWAQHARVISAVAHADGTGRTFEEVYAEIGRIPAIQFVRDHFTWEPDDIPGIFEDGFPTEPTGERSTGSSSASTNTPGTGPRRSRVSKASATSA